MIDPRHNRPAVTFTGVGEKVKLSMTTCAPAAAAIGLPIAIIIPAGHTLRIKVRHSMDGLLHES
jgi:hypothetical protein